MEITRRRLLGSAVAGAVAAPALQAQETPAPTAPDWLQVSREIAKRSADALAKVDLPMTTEPAFTFKA